MPGFGVRGFVGVAFRRGSTYFRNEFYRSEKVTFHRVDMVSRRLGLRELHAKCVELTPGQGVNRAVFTNIQQICHHFTHCDFN